MFGNTRAASGCRAIRAACALACLAAIVNGCVGTVSPPARVFGALQNDPALTPAQVRRGIRAVVVGVNWSRFEPRPGAVDEAYVQELRGRLDAFRQAGALICLDLSMHYPPNWLFSLPHSRYVNQYGQKYVDSEPGKDFANGVFSRPVRAAQQRHVENAFAALGSDYYAIRLGWGEYGELCYPRARYGGRNNCFWGYDPAAQGQAPDDLAEGLKACPVPGWLIGTPSPDNADARRFVAWYVDCLVNYQNWQVEIVRSRFSGPLLMMYPSWGVRPGVIDGLVRQDLASDTQEIQRGLDYQRLVGALQDPKAIVYCTWMDGNSPWVDEGSPDPQDWSPMHYLAHLAHTHRPRLEAWGENAAYPSDSRAMQRCFDRLQRFGVQGMIWAFERNLFDQSGRFASIDQYVAHIRGVLGR